MPSTTGPFGKRRSAATTRPHPQSTLPPTGLRATQKALQLKVAASSNTNTASSRRELVSANGQTVTITDEEYEYYREAFNLFDRDKSGAIDLHELGAVIQSLGMHATEAELRAMIANVDFDNTGTVEFDEFLQMSLDWMAQSNRQDTAEQLHEAFQSMDLDQDGYISTADLKDVMSDLASEDTTAGDGLAVEDLIKEFDLDGDGRLNFDDFNALMNEK